MLLLQLLQGVGDFGFVALSGRHHQREQGFGVVALQIVFGQAAVVQGAGVAADIAVVAFRRRVVAVGHLQGDAE